VIIPEETSFAKVFERFESGCRVLHIFIKFWWGWRFERRWLGHCTVGIDSQVLFKALDDRDAKSLMSYLDRI
jgi:hypothetical protein